MEVFESLFHCIYPVPTEPIEFRTHPVIKQIEASKCGYVRCKDEDSRMDIYTAKSTAAIVMECWTGKVLPPYTNVRHKNLNPYDCRLDNLEILVVDCPIRKENEKQFFMNTINEMLAREEQIGEYTDMKVYFERLGLQKRYIRSWMKRSPQCNEEQFEDFDYK